MIRSRLVRLSVVATATVVLAVSGACGKKDAPRGGEGEAINLNALADVENYKAILKKDPNNLQAHINLGNLYFDTKQDLLAVEHYRKALELDPRNSNVRTDMAIALRRTGHPDQAAEELKKVISTDPRHAQARYNLGVILIHDKGDIEGGIRAWEGLLENIPDYPYRDRLKAEIAQMRAMLQSTRPKGK